MNVKREYTAVIRMLLDELIPPVLRDRRFFMAPLIRLVFRDGANLFLDFKDRAVSYSLADMASVYQRVNRLYTRETDLNASCMERIDASITGKKVLEVGCGRGFLARKLSSRYHLTVTDIRLDARVTPLSGFRKKEAPVERLPFPAKSFDTVICTHTVEHVIDAAQAIRELRRVTRKRLIIVVPRQRPYRYTFDLHLHFFPYEFSVLFLFRPPKTHPFSLISLGGDWFYREDMRQDGRSRPLDVGGIINST